MIISAYSLNVPSMTSYVSLMYSRSGPLKVLFGSDPIVSSRCLLRAYRTFTEYLTL